MTPAPTLPAYEVMGDLLMEQDRPGDALASYVRSLQHHPERFNSLIGAARAAAALGDRLLARQYYEHVLRIAEAGSNRTELNEARSFLNQR